MNESSQMPVLVRHEAEAPKERSTCGWRHLLISRQDPHAAAWVHAVDIDGAREHYHRRATELYYVLQGQGSVVLDGVEHPVTAGSVVHIPPGVVHGAKGRMRVLVVGIPDISDDDLHFPERFESAANAGARKPMTKATWNGAVLAESEATQVVEGNHYFPPDSLQRQYLHPSDTTTVCGWKGTAHYYDVEVDGQVNKDAAWYYPQPKSDAKNIAGYVAFWKGVQVES